MLQDRHSLIHLVQRLRRENRSVPSEKTGQCQVRKQVSAAMVRKKISVAMVRTHISTCMVEKQVSDAMRKEISVAMVK